MSTPNEAVVAAAPILVNVINELQSFVNTVLTGDPAQIALRFDGAAKVLIGQIELQLPVLATSEIGVVNSDINAKLASWKNSLNALSAPKAA
ncbi:MAG TPA: hypothetical protein VFB37_00935 [Steroidobacteraceae bacterium]|nr:hypothetical protein [Steroidobacteraceae bacterium]